MAAAARHRQAPRSLKSASSVSTNNPPPPKPTSQQSTSLAKRLLFPNLPLGADLPPLLATPSTPELNAELYDFIALALRAFVNPWWTKITRYDKEFVVEVNRILTVVIRVLEERLINADLSPLVFGDIPTLVMQHYKDYRNAAAKVSTSYATGGSASLPQLFHQLQPHMAITAEGTIHEDYVRQAIDHILKACLPPEDYEPDTERYIIREIILKVLLGSVAPRVTQPWFIYKLILDQLGPAQVAAPVSEPADSTPSQPLFSLQSLTFQSLVVFFLSAVQSISTFCLALINAYKHLMLTIKLVNQSAPTQLRAQTIPDAASNMPPSPSPGSTPKSEDKVILGEPSDPSSQTPAHFHPSYADGPLAMVAELLNMRDRFTSSTAIGMIEWVAAASNPFLDKFLPYMLYKHALSSAQITNIVRIAKNTLFPNGYPAPPPIDPTPEEQILIRQNLEKRILEKVPAAALPLLGVTPEIRAETVRSLLDPLSSAACNAHLFLFVLDLILLAIFPEMAVAAALGGDTYTTGGTTDGEGNNGGGEGLGLGTLSRTTSITPPGSAPL
ncbi:hypothetical protein GLOTRDRAFT_135510 [Gloeophyllum trabeum ATCC 11539]|uniref:PXA domain-containing protein n=1 Tax=Gloeophyllum trabeum (strain ATCC 11539 / FP-39264 / Madison 617) TaxID=670483 RepID=S7QN88_GLOTA|nr:uncharacterized protein GLOTRDRAFT_135510 [Gloeophyllum trabeum ATCC 11539]EPQ60912.1 hypothetical protein GLOTRDRAFT_135510 [Gloeophyllum trabeum ATCC 11539]